MQSALRMCRGISFQIFVPVTKKVSPPSVSLVYLGHHTFNFEQPEIIDCDELLIEICSFKQLGSSPWILPLRHSLFDEQEDDSLTIPKNASILFNIGTPTTILQTQLPPKSSRVRVPLMTIIFLKEVPNEFILRNVFQFFLTIVNQYTHTFIQACTRSIRFLRVSFIFLVLDNHV